MHVLPLSDGEKKPPQKVTAECYLLLGRLGCWVVAVAGLGGVGILKVAGGTAFSLNTVALLDFGFFDIIVYLLDIVVKIKIIFAFLFSQFNAFL